MRNLEKCPECLQRFHVEWQKLIFLQKLYDDISEFLLIFYLFFLSLIFQWVVRKRNLKS
jgi:hypothetical protein